MCVLLGLLGTYWLYLAMPKSSGYEAVSGEAPSVERNPADPWEAVKLSRSQYDLAKNELYLCCRVYPGSLWRGQYESDQQAAACSSPNCCRRPPPQPPHRGPMQMACFMVRSFVARSSRLAAQPAGRNAAAAPGCAGGWDPDNLRSQRHALVGYSDPVKERILAFRPTRRGNPIPSPGLCLA